MFTATLNLVTHIALTYIVFGTEKMEFVLKVSSKNCFDQNIFQNGINALSRNG